jgi:steroid 5-alpha reductase family enzyme
MKLILSLIAFIIVMSVTITLLNNLQFYRDLTAVQTDITTKQSISRIGNYFDSRLGFWAVLNIIISSILIIWGVISVILYVISLIRYIRKRVLLKKHKKELKEQRENKEPEMNASFVNMVSNAGQPKSIEESPVLIQYNDQPTDYRPPPPNNPYL